MAERRSAVHAVYRPRRFGVRTETPGVRLALRPDIALTALRGNPHDAALRAAAQRELGRDLPDTVGTAHVMSCGTLFVVGPTEWWLECRHGADTVLPQVAGGHAVNLSDARMAVRVSGPHARDLLAKGCALDLHPREFPVGRCAQTSIAHVTALLHRVGGDTYDLYVSRSYGRHFWEWLEEGAAEFGAEVLAPVA